MPPSIIDISQVPGSKLPSAYVMAPPGMGDIREATADQDTTVTFIFDDVEEAWFFEPYKWFNPDISEPPAAPHYDSTHRCSLEEVVAALGDDLATYELVSNLIDHLTQYSWLFLALVYRRVKIRNVQGISSREEVRRLMLAYLNQVERCLAILRERIKESPGSYPVVSRELREHAQQIEATIQQVRYLGGR